MAETSPANTEPTKIRKPITVLSILVVAAMTFGTAVAEHFEKRAQHDRLSFGDAVDYITSPAQ